MRSATLFGVRSIVLLLILALILLRPKPFSDFAQGLRQGIREFRKASNEVSNESMETLYGGRSGKGDKIGEFILVLTAIFGTFALAILLYEMLNP